MTIEERYLFFEQRVEEANKILEEIYKCFFFFEEIKEKHKIKMKMIKYHCNNE
jgi:hypothetical protein